MKFEDTELQIEAKGAVPMAQGALMEAVAWYMVAPEKIVVCRYDSSVHKSIVEEFDARDIKLSGVPAGYFSNKSFPACDRPVHENDLS